MKRIFNHYKKIIIAFIVLTLAIAGGGYYYLYSTKIKQGNLNINKITSTNKIYNYTVYSDFYFRAYKYDKNGNIVANYSEIQPVQTSIGCIIKDKTFVPVFRNILGKKDILLDNNDTGVDKQIKMMQSVEPMFGDIITTQDNDYLNASLKRTKEIFKNLYNIDINNIDYNESKFYRQINNLPIKNMKIKYYKLSKIPNNIKGKIKIASKNKWNPNILEINFGADDKIYLQYIKRYSHINLNEYIKNNFHNKTIIKLTKINNNKLQTMYIIEDNINNKLKTLYMDANGYIYALIYKATNPESFQKYISDYLKLAYGIYFVDIKNFNNSYAKMQDKARKRGDEIFGLMFKQKKLDNEIGSDLLKYFGIPEDKNILYCIPNSVIGNVDNGFIFYKNDTLITKKYKIVDFATFYKYYNDLFPTKDSLDTYKKELQDKELLNEAIDKYSHIWNGYSGKEKIKEKCQNNQQIECIQNLKDNDWE